MRVLGEGVLMDPNRRLEDVYMFMLQVSRSRSLCALTGSRQNAFIRASWGSPWEHTVCQQRDSPLSGPLSSTKGAGREQFPHSQSLPHWAWIWTDTGGSELSKKGKSITNMLSLRLTSHGLIMWKEDYQCLCVILLHCTEGAGQAFMCVFYSTSGVNWALYPKFILKPGNTVRVC